MVQAIIYDLDGVIVSTDEHHYQAWKKLADSEGIYFDREINERLRGVSRMESLEIILKKADKPYTEEQKLEFATRKNNMYRKALEAITPNDILPGVMSFLEATKKQGLKIAIGSSSRNTPLILQRIGLDNYFDAVADGNQISKSKPHPEVFLLAAKLMGTTPENCLVVEDAEAGISAALNGGMYALGVGSAHSDKRAHFSAKDLSKISLNEILSKV